MPVTDIEQAPSLATPRTNRDFTKTKQVGMAKYSVDRANFLTKEQELELGALVQEMQKAKSTLSAEENLTDDKKAQLRVTISKGEEAVEKMVDGCIGLVISRAKKFKKKYPSSPDIEDLIQEGCVGLMNGILKYDPSRNNKLSTVAHPWIGQNIIRQTNMTGKTVRLPENRVSQYTKINTKREDYAELGLGTKREIDEIIRKEEKLSKADFSAIVNTAAGAVSLNTHIKSPSLGGSDDKELIDVIDLGHEPAVDQVVIENDMSSDIHVRVSALSEMHQDIISSSFGIDNRDNINEDMSPAEIRSKWGLSVQKYRSEMNKALKILREGMTEEGLTIQDFMV